MSQTMASGAPPAGRWSRLGFAAVPRSYDLNSMFGMVVGEQNSGKSYLMQSNRDAFIINADDSPVVNPKGEACIWPSRDSDGRIIDLDGRPMVLTWEQIEAKRKVLVDMATANVDRPRCVVLDTIFPAIRLLKQWVPKQLGRDQWDLCHGPAAWEKLYSTLIEFALSLRNHGYGVWFVAHVSKRWIPVDENKNVCEHSLSMPEGLKDRLSKTVEMIAPLRATLEVAQVPYKVERKVGDKSIVESKIRQETRIRRSIAFSLPDYAHLIRTRTIRPMQDVALDEGNPWEAFSRAFAEATT